MSEWPMVSLGDHVDLLTGYPFKSKEYTDNPNDICLISGYNIMQSYLRWDIVNRWPISKSDELERYRLQVDDVVLAMDRPWIEAGLKYAWMAQKDLPCLLVQRTARLRGTDTLDIRFLRHLIGSPQFTLYVKGIITGTAVPHISPTDIKSFRFLLPPLPEQRAIAAILGTWDRAIALTERRLAAAEQRKKALMQQLLTGRVRFAEFVKSTEKQSSKYGDLPADWKIIHLESVAEVNAESIGESLDPNRKYLYIDLSSVDRGIITMPTEYQAFGDLPSRARRILRKGDVVMATVRPNLLGFAVCDFEPENVLCSTGFALISPKELPDSHFIYQSLYSDMILKQVYGLVTGSNYPAINASEVKKLWFVWPTSAEERRKIATVLNACDRELDLLRRKRDALQQQKKGLMQRLLTGRVRLRGGPGLKPAGQTHEAPEGDWGRECSPQGFVGLAERFSARLWELARSSGLPREAQG